MSYEKLTEGSVEFCKQVVTTINLKTKAELEKELKNLLDNKAKVLEQVTEQEALINEQLDVFK